MYLLFVGLFLVQSVLGQFRIPDIPKNQTSVYDYVGLLSNNQKKTLERKLVRYSDSTSTQIVLAIISSTEGEDIGFLGANWLTKWGIGQKGKNNGILILLARKDRKIYINTGYGVEHLLTDYVSSKIVNEVIIPEFKRNDYYAGLNKGSDAIFKTLNGEFKGNKKSKKSSDSGIFRLFPIIFFIILFIILSNRNNRGGGRGGKRRRGLSLLDAIILSNAGRGFGGGSSGSFGGSSGGFGGGFSGGFGGGMGGGGGAGGSW